MSLLLIDGPWPPGRSARRWPLLALLAAAHIALLSLLGSQMQQTQRHAKAKPLWASLTLWLRPPQPARPIDPPGERLRRGPPAAATPPAVRQDLAPPAESVTPPASVSGDSNNSSSNETGDSSAAASATAAAGNARAPLRIELPKPGKPGQFTQFHNPALSDPRSNTKLRLTLEEKMSIALGTVACILEERQPDGTIWRGGGRLITVPSAIVATGAAAAGAGPAASVTQCVR